MRKTTRRRLMWGSAAVLGAAATGTAGVFYRMLHPPPASIGFEVPPDLLAQARALLGQFPSVDAHAHPGRTFVKDAENLSALVWLYAKQGTFEERTVQAMHSGGLTAAVFAAVADFQVLESRGNTLRAARDFAPGEAWQSYQRQIANLRALATRGLVAPVRSVADVEAARAAGKVGAILAVEGGDFLEGRPERVAQAFADGVRSITLMHYRHNALGDIITSSPLHGRLTDAGAEVVRAMNATGMLIDVAHASEATALGILRVSTKPVMASHVHVHGRSGIRNPRFISLPLAKEIARSGGGVMGAWPVGTAITDLRGFVDRSFALVDMVGIDHVCLGTDMDANFKPAFDDYAHLPHYVAGLLQRGMHPPEVAKLIGGNFLRVMAQQA